LREGVPAEVVDAIKYGHATAALDETDAVIIDLGREIFLHRAVSPETYARALAQFGIGRLVDLVALMGNYASTAAMLTAFAMQLDPGQEKLPRLGR
jgi:4-carboxymuconolactone decarboxylase